MSQVDESTPTQSLQENNSNLSESISLYWSDYWRRIKFGDLGSWPIFSGLLVIVIIFVLAMSVVSSSFAKGRGNSPDSSETSTFSTWF